jgi:putative transcriptional regulator
MSKFADDLLQGLAEAVAYANGQTDGVRVTVVEVPDVRGIRLGMGMSQAEFAAAFKIPLATLKNWEQGRRVPDGVAEAYLRVIAQVPGVVRGVLEGADV